MSVKLTFLREATAQAACEYSNDLGAFSQVCPPGSKTYLQTPVQKCDAEPLKARELAVLVLHSQRDSVHISQHARHTPLVGPELE